MARLIAIGDTAAEAEQVARQGAAWTISAYANKDNAGSAISAGMLTPARAEHGDAVDRYVNEVIIHGTPAQVVDKIQRLREEIALEYLLCAPVSHRSFMLLTEQVLPKFL